MLYIYVQLESKVSHFLYFEIIKIEYMKMYGYKLWNKHIFLNVIC